MNWISVKDRLPKEDEHIMAWAEGDWYEAVYVGGHFELLTTVYNHEPSHRDVTHWCKPRGPK